MTTDNFDDGRYFPDDKEAVLDALVADAEDAFGHEFSENEATIIRSFYDPAAERIVELHEGIRDVLNASQIEFAEGQALDYIGGRVGVSRKEGRQAEGREKFSRSNQATTSYTIPSGTIVETDELDAIEFSTDIPRTLGILDSFEDGDIAEYAGDTGSFSVVTDSSAPDGDYVLQKSATSGVSIINTSKQFGPGSVAHVYMNVGSSTVTNFLFGVVDSSNHYEVSVDQGAGSLSLNAIDGGGSSSLDSGSGTVPTSEWLELVIDWGTDNSITCTLYDAADNTIATASVSEDTTYDGYDLGIGFGSGDANATSLIDYVNMTSVGAPITAVNVGKAGNLGSEVLTIMPDPPTGTETATNPEPTSRGLDREEDRFYRERIRSELGEGVRGTQRGLIEQLEDLDGVRSVWTIENDDSSSDGDGRPPHSVEPIVETSSEYFDDVAQEISETKGTGYPTVGGYAGTSQTATAEFDNGQTKDITFSTPAEVKIYADIDVDVTDEYAGDDVLRDNLIRYIGGVLSTGDNKGGDLRSGDDVIYNTAMAAVASTEGVYDVTNLEIGTSSSPTGTSNITIADTEVATADATDGTLDVATTSV